MAHVQEKKIFPNLLLICVKVMLMGHVTKKKLFPILSLVCVTMIVILTLIVYQMKLTSVTNYFTTNTMCTATGHPESSIHRLKDNNKNRDLHSVFVYPLPGSSIAFQQSPVLPFFYRIRQSYHPSDKHRTHSTLDDSPPDVTMKRNESKLILFYNPPRWYRTTVMQSCQEGLNECPIKSCKCSKNRTDLQTADAVIVDAVDLNIETPMKKLASQVWIFFTAESPYHLRNTYYKSEHWRQMFNWTMTYRLDSDIPMPNGILLKQRVLKNYTAIAEKKRKSAVWLVSNCHTPAKRELYVEELNKYYNVDVFGKCGERTELDDVTLLNQYRFYLAFENSLCFDYITEKLFKTYAADINIIPVVRGGANYDTIIPNGTFINAAHFSTPKELGKHLAYLENNVTAYADSLQRNAQFGPRKWRETSYCDICIKLHHLKRYANWYKDIGEWYNDETCKGPTDYYPPPRS